MYRTAIFTAAMLFYGCAAAPVGRLVKQCLVLHRPALVKQCLVLRRPVMRACPPPDSYNKGIRLILRDYYALTLDYYALDTRLSDFNS